MRRTTLLICWLLAAQLLHSQVVVNLQLPPLGLTIKPQLWNLSLVNTSAQTMLVRVEMVMTEVHTNQRVLTGTSQAVPLPKGIKLLQAQDLGTITYNMGSPGYTIDPSPAGFLPTGVFRICYTILKIESDYADRLGEECETIEVEPISPPQLVMPLDEEAVDITRPFFAWVPPAPFNTLNGLLYDWVLVEVQSTQSPADAIQQNIPLLSRQNIAYTNFQYPLASPELDSSKLYAWRITAKNNLLPIANSEVWTFRVRTLEVDTNRYVSPGSFAQLQRTEDAAFVICSGVLRFAFTNEVNSQQMSLRLFDISSANRKSIAIEAPATPIVAGQNLLQVDLRNSSGMVNRHIYLLEVTDAKGEKGFLRFEYRE
ncbi:hypothetical protein [Paraflavitalea pollutisoli]|uniref:hypothetical protein n=1 Tax=Paraflavitalea pollutisoli TaxID=3034143 RepID=UPI0023ED52DC|nr:hypothetical protein [Paraflavitalea sp. H1-2-19X]